MDKEKIGAILSLIVAVAVLVASYFQWWDIAWNGGMVTKRWIKILFAFAILLLIIALFLIL